MPRALSSQGGPGFPNLDLIDHLSLLSHCPSHIIPSVAVLRCRDGISIILVFFYHRPDGSSRFVCDGNETMQISHETIDKSLFIQACGALKNELLAHLRSRRLCGEARRPAQLLPWTLKG